MTTARRRTGVLAGLLMLLAAMMPAVAQLRTPGKPIHIGFLSIANSEQSPACMAFRGVLRDLGYNEGRDVVLDYRFARGD